MDKQQVMGASSPEGEDRATRASTEPATRLGPDGRVSASADSGNMPGYFGILNADGKFWSHTAHGSIADARRYIREFWGTNIKQAEWCLRRFKIVPVRVQLTARSEP